MIILGCPDDVNKYVCADGELAHELQVRGHRPKYKDNDGCLYFKRTNKLLKFLAEIGVEL